MAASDEELEREQAQSLARIEQGQIPLNAARRLERFAREGGAFTSDLSVAEFALGHQLGLRPLTQVMGSCIYQVGWQYAREALYSYGGPVFQELDAVTEAYNEARGRSLARMREEARLAGADVVVGVRLQSGRYDWAENSLEFAAYGTAARDPGASRQGEALLTDLSLQDYWKLRQAGVEPCGLAIATSCFWVAATQETQMMGGLAGRLLFPENQEMTAYTQGVYEARETALGRLTGQMRTAGADGVVGVNITHSIAQHEMRGSLGNSAMPGLIVTFHAAGTAVRTGGQLSVRPPETTIPLSR